MARTDVWLVQWFQLKLSHPLLGYRQELLRQSGGKNTRLELVSGLRIKGEQFKITTDIKYTVRKENILEGFWLVLENMEAATGIALNRGCYLQSP